MENTLTHWGMSSPLRAAFKHTPSSRQALRLRGYAKRLRNDATVGELNLLPYMRRLSLDMRFQVPIAGIETLGYIADFAIPSKRYIIEVDGASHLPEKAQQKDELRSSRLNSMGWIVLRVSEASCLFSPKETAAAIKEAMYAIAHMNSDPWHDGFVTVDWHPCQMPGPKPRNEDKPIRVITSYK